MTDWFFEQYEVLAGPAGYWWHVLDRLESIDGSRKEYILEDATHTEQKQLHKDDVEGLSSEDPLFESLGWKTKQKPAVKRGYRVNGRLCEPSLVDRYKGTECLHTESCPECGADGNDELDIIHDHAESRVYIECRECGELAEANDES